jgi:hypothetical protein
MPYLKMLGFFWLMIGIYMLCICAAAKIAPGLGVYALMLAALPMILCVVAMRRKGVFKDCAASRHDMMRSGRPGLILKSLVYDVLSMGILGFGLGIGLCMYVVGWLGFIGPVMPPDAAAIPIIIAAGAGLGAIMWVFAYAHATGNKRLTYILWAALILYYLWSEYGGR